MITHPTISHDTRAMMAAHFCTAVWRKMPADLPEVVQQTDALILALGYQVMQPATSETLTQSQEPPPRPPTQAEIRRRLASYSTPAPRGRRKS